MEIIIGVIAVLAGAGVGVAYTALRNKPKRKQKRGIPEAYECQDEMQTPGSMVVMDDNSAEWEEKPKRGELPIQFAPYTAKASAYPFPYHVWSGPATGVSALPLYQYGTTGHSSISATNAESDLNDGG